MKYSFIFFLFIQSSFANDLNSIGTQLKPTIDKIFQISMNARKVQAADLDVALPNWHNYTENRSGKQEISGAIVIDNNDGKIKLINLSVGGSSDGVTYFDLKNGQQLLGRFHTHPYDYESTKNITFSPRDFTGLYQYGNGQHLVTGFVSMIISGTNYYALVVEDESLAKTFFSSEQTLATSLGKTIFDYMYSKYYSRNRGRSIEEIYENSLINITESSEISGIGFYRSLNCLDWKKLN